MSGHIDPINGALWALCNFDPLLCHWAELRQGLYRDHYMRPIIDQGIAMFLASRAESYHSSSARTLDEADIAMIDAYGEAQIAYTVEAAASLTDEPLMLEICGYTMIMGVSTNHGTAPWDRLAKFIDGCVAERHPVTV